MKKLPIKYELGRRQAVDPPHLTHPVPAHRQAEVHKKSQKLQQRCQLQRYITSSFIFRTQPYKPACSVSKRYNYLQLV